MQLLTSSQSTQHILWVGSELVDCCMPKCPFPLTRFQTKQLVLYAASLQLLCQLPRHVVCFFSWLRNWWNAACLHAADPSHMPYEAMRLREKFIHVFRQLLLHLVLTKHALSAACLVVHECRRSWQNAVCLKIVCRGLSISVPLCAT